jgi:membrane-associated phospholipid phosphatase
MSCQPDRRVPNLPLVLCSVLALSLLSTSSALHAALNNWESVVTVTSNSLIGVYPSLDHILGWMNTRVGDVLVVLLMAAMFATHSFRGSTFSEIVERLSFWGWVATLCITTYLLTCATEHLYCNAIPVQALPQLHDVRSMYNIPVHASAYNSYPSGHGLAYIFFALMAWYKRYRRMSLFILVLGTVMLSTRVILGMHWMSDILLGALPLSLILTYVATHTPLNRTYGPFNTFMYSALARVSGQSWVFERKAVSENQWGFRVTSWSNADVDLRQPETTVKDRLSRH